jgi:hypothetical protein
MRRTVYLVEDDVRELGLVVGERDVAGGNQDSTCVDGDVLVALLPPVEAAEHRITQRPKASG